jgi:hypothetical protein
MRGNFSAFFDGIVAVCSAIFRACAELAKAAVGKEVSHHVN